MLRRKIDRLLSEGEGRQLAWLAALVVTLFAVFCLVGSIWALKWTDILNLYLDPGSFPLEGHNIFSLIIAFGGILLLNALTVSAFSNVFDNISGKYRRGEKRYRMKGHVLIFGSGRQLEDMLRQMCSENCFKDSEIVVMSKEDVEQLRSRIETALDNKAFCRRIVWYRGDMSNADELRSACPGQACCIYLLGEEEDAQHDATLLHALDDLRGIVGTQGARIPCFLTLNRRTSMDMLSRLVRKEESRLCVEMVLSSDYLAEQLLVDSDFLPVPAEDKSLRLVIAGDTELARSVACVASQLCHFPEYAKNGRRSIISFVGEDMKRQMEEFTGQYRSLFELSHYTYVGAEGREEHSPDSGYGDFMDIEWEFVDAPLCSERLRGELTGWAEDPAVELAVALCFGESDENLDAALYLPQALRKAGVPVAVYQKESSIMVQKALACGQFGSLRCFGEAMEGCDALLLRRSQRGKRVNRLYDLEYGNPPAASEDEAWAGIPYAHKLSSIASADSIPMKLRIFGGSITEKVYDTLSEIEHRRWMASVLLMGYKAAPAAVRTDRSRFKELKNKEFIHLDIAPFAELAEEADKDTVIVKGISYILEG